MLVSDAYALEAKHACNKAAKIIWLRIDYDLFECKTYYITAFEVIQCLFTKSKTAAPRQTCKQFHPLGIDFAQIRLCNGENYHVIII